jgi:hypothetical protein
MEWWKHLDWSTMRNTYPKLSKQLQKRILDEGYWSLGKGHFEEEEVLSRTLMKECGCYSPDKLKEKEAKPT